MRVMQAIRLRLAHTFINRDFALFMGGSFISAMGMWFRVVTVSWVAFELTGSVFYLGVLTFAQLAPILFFGLLGGVLADRVDRRRLMLTVSTAVTIANTLLATLGAVNWLNPVTLLALVAILGLCDAVMFPTWQAVIKDLVPAQRLRAAVAVSSVRFNLSRVLAPALAGGLLSITGPAVCLAVSAGGSLGIILVTLAIRPRKLATSQPVSWWAAIGQGLDYARHEVGRALAPARDRWVRPAGTTVPSPLARLYPAPARLGPRWPRHVADSSGSWWHHRRSDYRQ